MRAARVRRGGGAEPNRTAYLTAWRTGKARSLRLEEEEEEGQNRMMIFPRRHRLETVSFIVVATV